MASKQPPPYNVVKGLVVPGFVDPEEVEKLRDLKLYPDDVWVVAYPKTGTTWTTQILKLIRNNGVPDDDPVDKTIPWLEARKRFYYDLNVDEMKRPRAFRSHFPYHLLPCGPPHTTPCKYIYAVRNPKDQAVSNYYHARKMMDISWDKFWKRHIKTGISYGNYFDHLLSWWPHRNDPNVLIIKYEDMKRALPQVISEIATFIGADISDEVVAKIADLTDFHRMKNDDTANGIWMEEFNNSGKSSFLRKGEVGDWKNYLSAQQSVQLDAICAEKLRGTGLEFDYELYPNRMMKSHL